MTEAEWLACTDPAPMLEFLRGKTSDRKLQLFVSASCRQIQPVLAEEHWRKAVEALELSADGRATAGEFEAAVTAAGEGASLLLWGAWSLAVKWVEGGALGAWSITRWPLAEDCTDDEYDAHYQAWAAEEPIERVEQQRRHGALLRCLFNPFRPSPPLPPAVLVWSDGTVRRMAQAIYDERAFDRLPILADALLDAGCDNEELTQHCRSAGPHVRGCWAVDRILGKA